MTSLFCVLFLSETFLVNDKNCQTKTNNVSKNEYKIMYFMSSVTNTGWHLAGSCRNIRPHHAIEIHSENDFVVSEGKPDFQIFVLYCTKGSNF